MNKGFFLSDIGSCITGLPLDGTLSRDTFRVPGSTIALKLDGMIKQLELTNPNLHKYCVNDNASNIRMVNWETAYWEECFCDNHTLQLAIGEAILYQKGCFFLHIV